MPEQEASVQTWDNPPVPPVAPGDPMPSFSMITCEKIFGGKDNVWVAAGTFNRFTIEVTKFDLDAHKWGTFPFGVYFKAQGIKERDLQVLFVLRITSVNGEKCDGAQSVAKCTIHFKGSSGLVGDGAFTVPGAEISTQPEIKPVEGRDNTVLVRLEAWADNLMVCHQCITLFFKWVKKKEGES